MTPMVLFCPDLAICAGYTRLEGGFLLCVYNDERAFHRALHIIY
jgi:hypothetical protein